MNEKKVKRMEKNGPSARISSQDVLISRVLRSDINRTPALIK